MSQVFLDWFNQATHLSLTAQQVNAAIATYWLIPAGAVALYFYGNFHFNTPDYRLVILQNPEKPSLLTLAPPKFTTSRSRFRRYALRYVLILEALFLSYVFLTNEYLYSAELFHLDSLVKDMQASASVEYRALTALFVLTGLLSSFPLFKDIDAWVLRWLHQMALIPDDAKLMAQRLFDVKYRPPKRTRDEVRQILISRDTMRFADGEIVGDLERRVVSLLWLNNQLRAKSTETGCEYFAVRFEIDLADVSKTFDRMKAELIAYFRDQAALVPLAANDGSKIIDIDQYLFDHSADSLVNQLKERRDKLQAECDSLYYRICLLTAVLAYSSESNADQINGLLLSIGFPIKVASNPIMDWDAVFRVVVSVFTLTALVNMLFIGLISWYEIKGLPGGGNQLLIFAALTTLLYFIVIYLALKVKRYWNVHPPSNRQIEDPLIALFCYGVTLPISIGISLWIRPNHDLSIVPFLFALNQGVVGYYIATYVNRSLAGKPFSSHVAALQGGCQAVAALFIYRAFDTPAFQHMSNKQYIAFGAVFLAQAAISGFLVGVIFQYFYRRTGTPKGDVVGDMTVMELPVSP